MELKPFHPGDLERIEGREYEKRLMGLAGNFADVFFARGPAFTLWDDATPIAAAGVVILWAGVGEAWMHLSNALYQHKKTVYKFTRIALGSIINEYKLHRVQAPICRTMRANRQWAEHLGFAPEGTMHRWGPDGNDYVMMSMVALEGEVLCLH